MSIVTRRGFTAGFGALSALFLLGCEETSPQAQDISSCADINSGEIAQFLASIKSKKVLVEGRTIAGQKIVEDIEAGAITVQSCDQGHYLFTEISTGRSALLDLSEKQELAKKGNDDTGTAFIVFMHGLNNALLNNYNRTTSGAVYFSGRSNPPPNLRGTSPPVTPPRPSAPPSTGGRSFVPAVRPAPVMPRFSPPSRCAREYKVCEEAPRPEAVLEKLRGIEIGRWRYKDEGEDAVRHISAYAEDFQQAFGVGDGKTLQWVDVMGVAMASIQALAEKADRLQGELDRLHGRVG